MNQKVTKHFNLLLYFTRARWTRLRARIHGTTAVFCFTSTLPLFFFQVYDVTDLLDNHPRHDNSIFVLFHFLFYFFILLQVYIRCNRLPERPRGVTAIFLVFTSFSCFIFLFYTCAMMGVTAVFCLLFLFFF